MHEIENGLVLRVQAAKEDYSPFRLRSDWKRPGDGQTACIYQSKYRESQREIFQEAPPLVGNEYL